MASTNIEIAQPHNMEEFSSGVHAMIAFIATYVAEAQASGSRKNVESVSPRAIASRFMRDFGIATVTPGPEPTSARTPLAELSVREPFSRGCAPASGSPLPARIPANAGPIPLPTGLASSSRGATKGGGIERAPVVNEVLSVLSAPTRGTPFRVGSVDDNEITLERAIEAVEQGESLERCMRLGVRGSKAGAVCGAAAVNPRADPIDQRCAKCAKLSSANPLKKEIETRNSAKKPPRARGKGLTGAPKGSEDASDHSGLPTSAGLPKLPVAQLAGVAAAAAGIANELGLGPAAPVLSASVLASEPEADQDGSTAAVAAPFSPRAPSNASSTSSSKRAPRSPAPETPKDQDTPSARTPLQHHKQHAPPTPDAIESEPDYGAEEQEPNSAKIAAQIAKAGLEPISQFKSGAFVTPRKGAENRIVVVETESGLFIIGKHAKDDYKASLRESEGKLSKFIKSLKRIDSEDAEIDSLIESGINKYHYRMSEREEITIIT